MINIEESKLWDAINAEIYNAVQFGILGDEVKKEYLLKVEGMVKLMAVATGEELAVLRARMKRGIEIQEENQRCMETAWRP